MRSFIVLILLWAHSVGVPVEPIIYCFPDKVQSCIQTWVDSFDETGKENLFFYLGSSGGSANEGYPFFLHLCTGRGSGEWGRMVERSNRWVRIGSALYPLLVDYDEIYGISCDQDFGQLGTLGKRDGMIRRSKTLFHGNTVYFDLKGKHVKCVPRLKKHIFSRSKSADNEVLSYYPKDSSSIIYIIPDKEELTLAATTEDYNLVFIHHEEEGISVDPVFEDKYLRYTQNSRRHVLVDTKAIPLVLNYDLLFSIENTMPL